MRIVFVFLVILAACGAQAFEKIPFASAKALQAARGKLFDAGLVFVNGKYVKPPYCVERWGTGLRINNQPVTGQVVDWVEFLKTQEGVKVTKTEVPVPVAAPVVAPTVPTPSPAETMDDDDDDEDTSLDDLFDDAPKKKAKPARPKVAKSPVVAPRVPAAPQVSVSYELEGPFKANAASAKLLEKINRERTTIDAHLRKGGFVFFGDGYSRVMGDKVMAANLLQRLPDILRNATDERQLVQDLRSAGFYFLNESVCHDLYQNRLDYTVLTGLRDKRQRQAKLDKMLQQ